MRFYINALRNTILKPLTMRQLPIHIQLEPTTYCNMNCKTCGRAQYLKRSTHLSTEEFKYILERIEPKKVTLSGLGESFMNPNLLEMIHLAEEHGISINTTTNGTLLTLERCEQIVKSGLDLIKISIDGATRETYRTIRGEDRFFQVLDGIRAVTEAKKRLGSSRPFIRFNYVMSKANYHEIAKTVELAHKLGVDAIYFQPLELVGIEDRQELLVGDLTYKNFFQEIIHAFDVSRQLQINTNLQALLKKLPIYWRKYQFEVHQKDSRKCILPWFSTYITVEGIVRPCCAFSQTKADMGNVLENDIKEIWNGGRYQRFRKAIREGKRPFSICKNCVPRTLPDFIRYSRILPGFLR